MNTRELLKAKSEAKGKAEAILAAVQNRDMTVEENATFDGMVAEVKRIDSLLAKAEQLASFTNEPPKEVKAAVENRSEIQMKATSTPEYSEAFLAYARHGNNITPSFVATLNEGSSAAGGIMLPTQLDSDIVKKAYPLVAMRQLARVTQTSSDRAIVIRNAEATAAWTAAAAGITEVSPTYAGVTLKAYKLAAYVKVDNELLFDAYYDLSSELSDQFARAFALKEDEGFCIGTGSGNGQPAGVFPNAATGVTTPASPTAISADDIIGVFHALKPAYRNSASWLMNDSTALQLRKLKFQIGTDVVGFMWQPSLQEGTPDRLIGRPVFYSVNAPSAASTTVPIVFGDFKAGYRIADRVPRTFQRLNELYAINDQTGFVSTQRVDGAIVLAEAITSLKMHA
jgi:HK97 family phage major capsid protein